MASNTSSIGVVRDRRDVRRSFSQWKKLTKTLLRAKAAEFGLEQQGNKETLALRIHSHFHPAIPNPPADEPIEEQEIEEPMSPQLSIASTNSIMPPPEAPRPASMVSMSLDDLKALMKDVSSKASRQADINPLPVPQPGTLQLSPHQQFPTRPLPPSHSPSTLSQQQISLHPNLPLKSCQQKIKRCQPPPAYYTEVTLNHYFTLP